MGIVTGQTVETSDFINQSQKNATPANDVSRVPKLESDGRLSSFFTRNGSVINCGETINGATTPVPVYQNKTDNELYACDANDTNKMKFIGFVISNGTDGNPATFQGSGIVAGFTGLAEGEKYYVQDTAGTISTTIGTYGILVGIAISETELLIQKGGRQVVSSHSILDAGNGGQTQNLTITTGFRVSKASISGVNGSSFYGAVLDDNSLEYVGSGSLNWQIALSSITDTAITFTFTQNVDNPGTLVIAMLLQGEL